MEYEILDSITSADLAFRVTAPDRNLLFLQGALALMSIMIENREDISPHHVLTIELTDTEMEMLYYRFLQEFLYFRDAELLLLVPESVTITEEDGLLRLTCMARGERADRVKHRFNTDIKAVTMHHLLVEEDTQGWNAVAVLDL